MKLRFAAALLALGLAVTAWGTWDLYRPYPGFTGHVLLEIPSGTSAPAVAGLLLSHGVIAHRWPFLALTGVGRARHRRLKAGEYLFDRPLRPIDVYRKLAVGDVYLYSVVIPEGSDRFDIARILADRMAIDPADFLRHTQQTSLIHDLDPDAPSLEGYLFPDTYRFPRGVSADTVIATLLLRFRHVLQTRFHQERSSGAESLHAVVTLASLVEKETPDPVERPLVAGVFMRRLEKGMLLQCDPTVIYAARLDDRPIPVIHMSDLNFDSPFNTYRYAGLPPGPIANPGESALRAAFHPTEGDEIYFVSNNHGGHVFAKSLTEHQGNVAKYRRELGLRSQKPEARSQRSGAGSQKPEAGSQKSGAGSRNLAHGTK